MSMVRYTVYGRLSPNPGLIPALVRITITGSSRNVHELVR